MKSPSPYRILVVDDDEALHGVFGCMLAPATDLPAPASARSREAPFPRALMPTEFPRFEIDFAFQGQEGLERIRQAQAEERPYTMAFIDVRMPPGWDGIETISRVWKEAFNLQIIICTGHADFSWHDLIQRFGHTDRLLILKKPFDMMEVRQVAYSLAEKWDLARQAQSHVDHLQQLVSERTAKLEETNLSLQQQIAENERAERARSLMEIQLRHAQKLESIGQLAAGIAHEINTPTQYIGDNIRFLESSFAQLNGLQTHYQQLLEAAKLDALTPKLIAQVEASAEGANLDFLLKEIPAAISQTLEGVDRVAHIVRAMKDFSHPGFSEKTPIDLNHAVETTMTIAHHEWRYVATAETCFDRTLPLVPCLPGELNQVILNLLVNAAHAIAEVSDGKNPGLITVTTRCAGDWAEILVADTGAGIPEKIRDKIFDPFFTTKAVGKGTGQGLAIAHTVIVDRHQGQLTFTTEPGRGSVFTIRLPLQPASCKKEELKS